MARTTMPLTDKEIKNAKPREKEYKLFDGNGLYMTITPDGGKRWRLKYSFEGKEKRLSLGIYPDISLSDARVKRDQLRTSIAKGIDPSAERKEAKATTEAKKIETKALKEGQFHKVVYGWLDTLTNDETTKAKRKRAFERDIFPSLCTYDENRNIISSTHIGEITHSELLKIINEKEKTAAETARRLLTDCGRLWLYAISHGHATFNITTNISKKDALQKQVKSHYAKITDEKILGELLRAIDNYNGVIVRNVLRLVSLIPLRADNLCKLKWAYIDFDKALLTIPRSEMKVKDKNMPDFVLPLPHQAITILKEIKEVTGFGVWVFHGISQPLTHVYTIQKVP